MPSYTPAEIVAYIDEDGWNPDPAALQDADTPLYLSRIQRDFIGGLSFRLETLDLGSLALARSDHLAVLESTRRCRSAAREWARDPRSKAKLQGGVGKARDNPVIVIRRILDAVKTDDPALGGEQEPAAITRGRLTESEILAEIDEGETEFQEFKSSLRWNLEEDRKDRKITEEAVEGYCQVKDPTLRSGRAAAWTRVASAGNYLAPGSKGASPKHPVVRGS